MEELFGGNIIFIFFFAMIAIYNYSDLKEYQRIAIIYITVYFLALANIVEIYLALVLLFLTMFCFLEVLTKDEVKFKIVVNPFYKAIDCLYLSFFQYSILAVLLAIVFCHKVFQCLFYGSKPIFMTMSAVMIVIAVMQVLQQKFVINSFSEMYKIFMDFPINRVKFDNKLNEACSILISIEDRTYYERKGYTFLSVNAIKCIVRRRVANNDINGKFEYVFSAGKRFIKNVLKEDRGHSTIPMQLIRSLGVKRGYNYKYRRKVFEFLYARIFFEGIKRMLEEDKVAKREYIKQYFLYIYFHKVHFFGGCYI